MTAATTIERIQAGDELERCPLPIPFGWFDVGLSEDIKPGEIKNVHYFGRDWVMFRGEEGKVGMTDPYCPHLGAHLGHGGVVEGDNIRCPFHHWQFDAEGWCKKIPYAKVMPGITRRMPVLKALPIEEKYGIIFAWYHPNGEAPSYPLITIPEFEAPEGEYVPLTRGVWDVATMIQEMGENGVDYPHLRFLHNFPTVPPGKPWADGYQFHNEIGEDFLKVESVGPGTSTQRFKRDGVVLTTFASSTPVDHDLSRMRWTFTNLNYPKDSKEYQVAAHLRQHAVGAAEGEQSSGFEAVDMIIWENKKYRPNPLLCDGDGPILLWRQWFKQFLVEPHEPTA